MKKNHLWAVLAVGTACVGAQSASAAITWTDWTSATTNQVAGTAGGVDVTFTGAYMDAQLTSSTNWYTGTAFPSAYKPSNTDIIRLSAGGTKTITFSQAVTGVYLALVSWNVPGAGVTFSDTFTTIVNGSGAYGAGTLPASGTGFSNAGEVHGVIRFDGPITSLTFTDTSEGWHGFTVGFDGIAAAAVPEPASWALMVGGFGLVGAGLRRRKAATVRFA